MKEKIIVVMPAYNAEKTLEKTIKEIPENIVDEIILVDDKSTDNTVKVALSLGLSVITHNKNKGYGGNQKTCYNLALEKGADYIVMLHPDYQYDARIIPSALDFLKLKICDVILGNRIRTRKETIQCGMPLYKYFSNRFLTILENFITGQNLGEWHSGFRIYTKNVLQTIPYEKNSDDFVFDTQVLLQAIYFNFKIGDVPIPVRYFEEASSINFLRSTIYGLRSVLCLIQFVLQSLKICKFQWFLKK
jgi:glycosyltransferase involved in cell wall biosynthesis